MSDYKTKCLSILEGVDWETQVKEFPLITSVSSEKDVNRMVFWWINYADNETDGSYGFILLCDAGDSSASKWILAYALLSHRVPQPDENGLLPCFRCNGKAELTSRYIANSSTDDEYVCCIECGLRTREHETETGAMEDWNRRANQGGTEQ